MQFSASHLIADAEALAYPFVAPGELRAVRTGVDHPTATLGLRDRLSAHGLADSAPGYLRRAWPESCQIIVRLREHAERLLYPDHHALRLHTDPEVPGREILCWRYISLALPAGILLAAATPKGARPGLRLDLLHPSFAPAGPVAHLHLHVGAASSFEGLWTNLVTRQLPTPHDFTRATKLPPTIDRDEWLSLLTRAALARPVLHALATCPALNLEAAIGRHRSSGAYGAEITSALDELMAGRIATTTGLREARLRKLAASTSRIPRSLADIWTADPIADGGTWPEGRMIALLFDRLADRPDNPATKLFVQYLRVKCLLHRLLVHDPAERGLNTFVHTFRQINPYRTGLDELLPDFALDEPALDLRAVEVRTAPPRTGHEAKLWVDNLEKRARDTEVAWVFHFIRDPRPPTRKNQSPTIGDCYCALYRALRQSATGLALALRASPYTLLPLVRGLDIAGNERKGPLWIALPQFKHLRDLSRELAAGHALAPLRLTLHVGEDFCHLASGLRAVHEPFTWRLIERGDRLGHALALGIDPNTWCDKCPTVQIPRWERMLDLAWMIAALTHRLPDLRVAGDDHGLRLTLMYQELGEHIREADLVPNAPDRFVDLFTTYLADRRSLRRLLDQQLIPATDDPLHLLYLRLRGPAQLQARLDEGISVHTDHERPLLAALSREVARIVRSWQITIEVNPSSNLLIAGLDHILQQPIFRLHPLDGPDGAALPVTLNADDPLTFATTLADEYAYTWAALTIAADLSHGYARHWLDETARASWRARFTLPRRS